MDAIKTIKDCRRKAERGNILAQKQLGLLLIRSNETFHEGFSWLKKAAETDTEAMYMLARVHMKRINVPEKALYWCEQAALNGHVDAMIDTAAFYLFGYGVERNMNTAIGWYKTAAELKSPVANHNLGFLCLMDPELYTTAVSFFNRAMKMGYADSAYMLGVLYLQGYGVEKSPELALKHLVSSYELGKHYACRPIGDLFFQGVFDNGQQNFDKAHEWYRRGASHDVLSCIEVLGDCYYYGFGIDTDLKCAYEFYTTAAEKGSQNAAFILGLMFAKGEAVKRNYVEALKWMIVAEKRGYSKASEFVKSLTDILNNERAAVAPGLSANGGSAGVKLRSSYSAGAEAVIAQQKAQFEQNKQKHKSIYAAAGAMSGDGSHTDYEMGAVINPDGEVSYVDTDLGVILGADGSVSSHDTQTGLTYNWRTGNMLVYNEMFDATYDFHSGKTSYHFDGYTLQ